MAQKPQQTLDNLMMAYADLSGPGKGSSFKGPPVKDIKVHKASTSAFRQSEKARDWTSLAQNLEEAFSGPKQPIIPGQQLSQQQQQQQLQKQQQQHHRPHPTQQLPQSSLAAQDTTDDFGDFQSCHPPPKSLEPAVVMAQLPPVSSGGLSFSLDDDFADFVAARPISNPEKPILHKQQQQQQQPLPPQQPLPLRQPLPPMESQPTVAAADDFGSFSSSSPAVPEFANFSKTPGVAPLLVATSPPPLGAAKANITANFNFEIFQSASSSTGTTAPPLLQSGPASLPAVPPGVMAPPIVPSGGGGGGGGAGDKYGALRDVFSVEGDANAASGRQFNRTSFDFSFGLKNGLGFHFDPATCLIYLFLKF